MAHRRLDLSGLPRVVGLTRRDPGLDALSELHEAHVRAFPFENIDVLLGNHPGVSLEAVQEKFVGRRRGGYCFEHGTLFSAVLERLGYDVRRHLGRVGDATKAAPDPLRVVVILTASGTLRPGLRDEPAAPDPDGGRRRARRTAGATGCAVSNRESGAVLGAAPAPRGRVGADAHHRRAPGAPGRRTRWGTTSPAPSRSRTSARPDPDPAPRGPARHRHHTRP